MKVFISSVIHGFGRERDAAERAATTLDHTIVRSESFGAQPTSPQRACRAAVRDADVVVLLLGGTYGTKDPRTGKSPTHEEFEEAQATGRDVLAFVQDGVERDDDQAAFVREVQAWSGGALTAHFRTPEELRDALTQALSRLALSRSAGPVDPGEVAQRLDAAFAADPSSRGAGEPMLVVALVGAPRQVVRSAGELDDPQLQRALERDALYGDTAVLERGAATRTAARGDALEIVQERRRVRIDSVGTIVVTAPARRPRNERDWMPAIIDEDVRDAIAQAIRYGLATLDVLDPYARVSDLAVGAAAREIGSTSWMTRAERERDPNSVPMNIRRVEAVSAKTDPLTRKRASVKRQSDAIARDLVALLRRRATE